MRRLVYIGAFDLPDKNAAAHRVLGNAKLFRELGYDVIFIGMHKRREYPGNKIEECNGFKVYSLPYPEGFLDWCVSYLTIKPHLKIFQQLKLSDIKAVIFYNSPALLQFRLMRHLRRWRILSISDATEWYAATGTGLRRLVKSIDVFVRMNYLHCKVDGLITTSPFLTKFYSQKRISGSSILMLPTLFDAADTVVNDGVLPLEQNNMLRIMYFGSPFDVDSKAKKVTIKERMDLVIRVAKIMNRESKAAVFEIYGISEGDYLMIYPGDAGWLACNRSVVKFMGRVSNLEVREALHRSDFSIFFRDRSRVTDAGFPSKFAESITFGVPVITNNMPSLEGYAENRKNAVILDIQNDVIFELEIEKLLSINRNQIEEMKKYCKTSKMFCYSNFKHGAGLFFKEFEEHEFI